MIRIAFIFIVGIALTLTAIYDWRIAMRITIPIAVVIALLISLVMYQTNHERQQREAQRASQERQERMEKTTIHNSTTDVQKRKEDAEIELQRIERADEKRRLEERKRVIKTFFANTSSLIHVYLSSASLCHSGLMSGGKMDENADCQAANKAKDELNQAMETLVGISKKELKKEDFTAMWKIEYAENQMEYAYHLSKHRK